MWAVLAGQEWAGEQLLLNHFSSPVRASSMTHYPAGSNYVAQSFWNNW